jgi:2-polyprenyl-6-hydroxyphenyl methylase/3-demethylubiquinone-9 3-methyltransferase
MAEAAGRQPGASTAAADEIKRFAALAGTWWDTEGEFGQLHKLNPVRIGFIRDHVLAHFRRDGTRPEPFEGLSMVDLGCGGGLLTEPMARLGAGVLGIDAEANAVGVARAHAQTLGLDIEYRCALPEALAAEGRRFDVVLAMEVIEHVADIDRFVSACASLMTPGGAMVLSTLNRTLKALALAKIGAEYVLRWVPPGTHDWRKFVRPDELSRHLRSHGLRATAVRGMRYDPLRDRWALSDDLSVNYLAFITARSRP